MRSKNSGVPLMSPVSEVQIKDAEAAGCLSKFQKVGGALHGATRSGVRLTV